VAVLPSHLAAMNLAARTDLVCLVPAGGLDAGPGPMTDPALVLGLRLLEVPLELPPLVIGMAWHPRHAADGGHGWLRSAVRRALVATPVPR
jgi:DNA-binding transcriptional LysR family regulator